LQRLREIPYNYTSYSDREIVLRFLGADAWDDLNVLRAQRRTGRSARMLFEILGDLWLVERNAFVRDDLLRHRKRREAMRKRHKMRLQWIIDHAEGNQRALALAAKTAEALNRFYRWFDEEPKRRKQAKAAFARHTDEANIHFDPYTLTHHATDATDWRSHLPFCVITPDAAEELPGIVREAKRLGLAIIPRGGGTGLCGGSVPLDARSVVVNLEKLDWIGKVEEREIRGQKVPTIAAGAGAITGRVMEAAKPYIFATDPTSLWACTIGGNVATNAGGKHAVIWGTCLDNLLSWKMVTPSGDWLTVERLDHNLGKIHDEEEVRFRLRWTSSEDGRLLREELLTLPGSAFRAPGLGKDVTRKALGGLPGVQKEGTDGFVVEARFVLHKPFAHTYTVCCEFFGHDLARATEAMVKIKQAIDAREDVVIEALEHFDEKYIKAIDYAPKSASGRRPRVVLLIDLSGDDERKVAQAASEVCRIAAEADGAGIVAAADEDRARFWADRGRMAAIAKHTRAFKLNEDVVIPLARLAEYSDFVERQNIELSIDNKIEALHRIQGFLAEARAQAKGDRLEKARIGAGDDVYLVEKIDRALRLVERVRERWHRFLRGLDRPAREQADLLAGLNEDLAQPLWRIIQKGALVISYRREVEAPLLELFAAHPEIVDGIKKAHAEALSSRLVIATHMHAGDGNVHTNIPVNSNDYAMLRRAHALVEKIMAKAVELGGVISGEHGIGITKLAFMPKERLEEMQAYLRRVDPEDLFNPKKLQPDCDLSLLFTPSLQLLEMEAKILEAAEMTELVETISPCLRCGKCKPVCSTHVPRASLLYSPRNKILAASAIVEAFLYESQTGEGISFEAFAAFDEVAAHCTLCHKCATPCPVDIDFGEVTERMRALLAARGMRRTNPGASLAMRFLDAERASTVHALREGVLRPGYAAHRLAAKAIASIGLASERPAAMRGVRSQIVRFFERPLPEIRRGTMRQRLQLRAQPNLVPVLRDPKRAGSRAVFYFPGCGSERLYGEIGIATLAWLFELGLQVALPPGYRCCGYPMRAAGDRKRVHQLGYENHVLFQRIQKALAYLDFEAIVVSCGTCYDQLDEHELSSAFGGVPIVDIHEFLAAEGVRVDNIDGKRYLYHDPCHMPLKRHGSKAAIRALLDADAVKTNHCCGEAGTLAVTHPEIAAGVRARKEEETQKALAALGEKQATVLTSCPACLQGLSRMEEATNTKADYIVVELARRRWGEHWQQRFAERVRQGGVEYVPL